jgi:hypothetical protein
MKLLIKFLLPALLLQAAALAQKQGVAKTEEGRWLVLEAGYLRQGEQHRSEAGLGFHKVRRWLQKKDSVSENTRTVSWGPVFGLIGFVNRNNTFRLGQQIGYSLVYNNVRHIPWGFKTTVTAENYTRKDQRISFAGGPLLLGVLHIQYGYSIPLRKETIGGIGRHRLGIILYINTIGMYEWFERTPMM